MDDDDDDKWPNCNLNMQHQLQHQNIINNVAGRGTHSSLLTQTITGQDSQHPRWCMKRVTAILLITHIVRVCDDRICLSVTKTYYHVTLVGYIRGNYQCTQAATAGAKAEAEPRVHDEVSKVAYFILQ